MWLNRYFVRAVGGVKMDKETKEYVDKEILNMGNKIQGIFNVVKRDVTDLQKKVKKLSE